MTRRPWLSSLLAARSLGFGATLGSGLASLAYVLWPHLFPVGDVRIIAGSGATIGFALHRLIATLTAPARGTVEHYAALVEISLHHRAGLIDDDQKRRYVSHWTDKRFLGEVRREEVPASPGDNPALPGDDFI